MGKKGRLKGRPPTGGYRIAAPAEPRDPRDLPAVISLQHCQYGDHCYTKLDQDNKVAFANAVFTRRSMNWKELQNAPRHGNGFEKISHKSINPPLPAIVTDNDKTLIAFRFNGKAPMVGYRDRNIFFVLFFDPNFCLYNHG